MSQTTNYDLSKPAATDTYDIAVPNGNMDKIDAALIERARRETTNPPAGTTGHKGDFWYNATDKKLFQCSGGTTWTEITLGGNYTAGDGITITGGEIAADYTKVAKKSDIDGKVDKIWSTPQMENQPLGFGGTDNKELVPLSSMTVSQATVAKNFAISSSGSEKELEIEPWTPNVVFRMADGAKIAVATHGGIIGDESYLANNQDVVPRPATIATGDVDKVFALESYNATTKKMTVKMVSAGSGGETVVWTPKTTTGNEIATIKIGSADAISVKNGVDLSTKLNVPGDDPNMPGNVLRLPYFFEQMVQNDRIKVKAHTIKLDNSSPKVDEVFSLDVLPMDYDNDKAGLYTKLLADNKADADMRTDYWKTAYVGIVGTDRKLTAYQLPFEDVVRKSEDIVDGYTSTATDKALSAAKGKDLDERINALSPMGRYLSTWNCQTGLPATNPTTMPYTYRTGDYYVVSAIKDTLDNLIPSGTEYNGSASTTTTTASIAVNDTFRFDGTTWVHVAAETTPTAFSSLVGSPMDNTNLASALNSKLNLPGNAPGTSQPLRLSYFFEQEVQADKVVVKAYTVKLDNSTQPQTPEIYPMDVAAADITGNKAGLYTKTLADLKQDKLTAVTNAEIDTMWS